MDKVHCPACGTAITHEKAFKCAFPLPPSQSSLSEPRSVPLSPGEMPSFHGVHPEAALEKQSQRLAEKLSVPMADSPAQKLHQISKCAQSCFWSKAAKRPAELHTVLFCIVCGFHFSSDVPSDFQRPGRAWEPSDAYFLHFWMRYGSEEHRPPQGGAAPVNSIQSPPLIAGFSPKAFFQAGQGWLLYCQVGGDCIARSLASAHLGCQGNLWGSPAFIFFYSIFLRGGHNTAKVEGQ